jgi:hypothetical protein
MNIIRLTLMLRRKSRKLLLLYMVKSYAMSVKRILQHALPRKMMAVEARSPKRKIRIPSSLVW